MPQSIAVFHSAVVFFNRLSSEDFEAMKGNQNLQVFRDCLGHKSLPFCSCVLDRLEDVEGIQGN